MFEWASYHHAKHGEKVMLIAGHTHHPVVPSDPPPNLEAEVAKAAAALEAARQEQPPDAAAVAAARARHEEAKTRARPQRTGISARDQSALYFNSGCCSFGDGDVTGLEIFNRRIRLVRWLDDQGALAPKELSPSLALDELFDGF